MLSLQGTELAAEDIAVLCRRAENDYVQSPCGIMDQFVVTAAKAGHALLLNTRTLSFEHLPMKKGKLAKTCIVICNSMVKHSIASGEYGVRHHQVIQGQQDTPREVSRSDRSRPRDPGSAECLPKRYDARVASAMPPHHLGECARSGSEASDARRGDPVAFGELITEGHASERNDFACSCDEIDFLVETSSRLRGCFGARLTGGGFGGCTVNLVEQRHAGDFAVELKRAYREKFHIDASTFECEAVDGAMHSKVAAVEEVPA